MGYKFNPKKFESYQEKIPKINESKNPKRQYILFSIKSVKLYEKCGGEKKSVTHSGGFLTSITNDKWSPLTA